MELTDARMKMMSGAHIIADVLRAAPPTKIVNTKYLREGQRGAYITLSAASGAIDKLKKAGILRPLGHGNYTIDKDKCFAYYKNKTFNKAYGKSRAQIAKEAASSPTRAILGGPADKIAPSGPMFDSPSTPVSDMDIINNLLDALAQAEPILQKYKKIIEAVHA